MIRVQRKERPNQLFVLCNARRLCYREFMIDETAYYPTQEELRKAMDKAVRRGFMKPNGDGTFSITEAGEEYVIEFLLTPDTIH